MSEKANQKTDHLPPQTKFIVGNEACERFSYYGIRSILAGYITGEVAKGGLDQSPDTSTSVIHLFIFANYFMPLFGAWLSDRLIGRYYTILYVSLIYCLGNGVLACGDFFGTVNAKMICLCGGLALIAIGSGGIKPCVSAFMGDQFKPEQGHLLQKAYGAFYWAINFGSFFSFLVVPAVKNKVGYGWAFGVPGILMALATLIFWLGTRHYVRIPPARTTKTAGFLTVFLSAFRLQAKMTAGPIINVLASLALPLATMVGLTIVSLSVSSTLSVGDIKDLTAFCKKLKQPADPVSQFLASSLSEEARLKASQFAQGGGEDRTVQAALIKEINELLGGTNQLYTADRFKAVTLSEKTSRLMAGSPKGPDLVRLNRMLLEDAYPSEITRKSFGYELVPAVRAIGWGALYGVGAWYVLIVGLSLMRRLELPDHFWRAALDRHKDTEVGAARSVGPILFVFSLVPVFWALFDQTTSTWVLQGERLIPVRISGSPRMSGDSFLNAAALANKVRSQADPVSKFLWNGFSSQAREVLSDPQAKAGSQRAILAEELNKVVVGSGIYDKELFGRVGLSPETRNLLEQKPTGDKLALLNRLLLGDAYRVEIASFGITIGAEEMQSANPLLVMVLVPLLTLGIYPRLGRLASPLRRMSAGMFFGAVSYVIVAWLQRRVDGGAELSVLWQFAPYIVLTTGEVLLSTTGLEFAFAESAPEMRSTIMSFWLLTVALGNLIVSGVTKLMGGGGAHAESVTPERFLLYAAMTAVVAVLFSLVASRYQYRHPAFKK